MKSLIGASHASASMQAATASSSAGTRRDAEMGCSGRSNQIGSSGRMADVARRQTKNIGARRGAQDASAK